MKRNQLIALVLAGTAALQATLATAAVQDNDNLDACCLASEYRLQQAAPSQVAAKTAKAACQVPLGDVSCCVGAEWKLDSATAQAPVAKVTTATAPRSQPQSDDSFCCIASEWSAR